MSNPINESTILLVDDETDITDMIEEVLLQDGFRHIYKANCGQAAVDICKQNDPDVIVLDVMLPDIDGIEVCRKIRSFTYAPILFLSSKNDDVDKILGLSCGGDDYITKPFSPRELVFRIKAQLRRLQYNRSDQSTHTNTIEAGTLVADTDACCVTCSGKLLDLTAREFKMLLYFMENPGKIISKEHLYEQVWGELSAVCDNTIMVHIRHLREKIEDDASHPTKIITVKGLGYRFAKPTGKQA
ncbi:MAG: response regulator transcription factor [Oscillospiraceae bacterium]|nr:response regulator transcription factor [Oscillospiraceae bacterium]